ncbi:hypothetical protein AW27_034200 (plasmid) [Streptomyces sp. PCS3-D2]|uniref:hypothetical protein n=1 Tax=Streptomyces sp. PCS3-D2 TaxID=1460244 RepID=UPI000449FB1E|nr:hypothetical protein [Streptomyces sp. PCS3-D2]WKV76619.1 hypothetical protein AW27_034200 [Streptomyces sp. PCS3-D2]
MSISFGTMPHHCTGTVTTAVEAYSPAGGTAHGNLDATAYVCPNHVQTARDMWQAQGLTPYSTSATGSSRSCGGTTDFRETAPASTATTEG